jgi:hypothetical protein
MVSAQFLGFVALGLAVLGLLAVVLEAAVRSPSALLDILLDSRRMALPEPQPTTGERVRIGYVVPRAAANAGRRAAA